MALFSFLYNDRHTLDYNVFLATMKSKIDLIKIDLELEDKMNKRVSLKVPKLSDDLDYNALKLMIIDNSIQSQVLRSRLCHLHIEIHKILKRLSDREETLRKYLFITYKAQLEQLGLKTQADKNYLIDSCFLDSALYVSELATLKESIQFLMEDLDKNLYTIKHLVSLLELSFKTRTNI